MRPCTAPLPFSLAPVSSVTVPSSLSLRVTDEGRPRTARHADALARLCGSLAPASHVAAPPARHGSAPTSSKTCPVG